MKSAPAALPPVRLCCCTTSTSPLVKLAQQIGRDRAERAYQLSYRSIDSIEDLALGLPVDVDFCRNRSIYLACDAPTAQDVRLEVAARKSSGLSVEYHTQQQLRDDFGLLGPAALSTTQAASCDPIRFSRALLQRATQSGARVFDGTQIVNFDYHRNQILLTTRSGMTIQAKHGIIACGYESIRLLKEPIVSLNNTYALISQPLVDLAPWNRQWMLWEARDPYLYMRVTMDNRLLVGGEDDELVDAATRDSRIAAKMQTLHAKLRSLLPELEWQPATGWAGTFGQTKDGLPYIGRTPEMPGYIFALGFGGNGMTFSEIACQQILGMVRGESTPDAELFRFQR